MSPSRRADMFIDLSEDPREGAPTTGDERAVLAGLLRAQRLTLEMKCAGLDPEQMARRSVEPSTLSLLGLVRHLSEAEREWFRNVMARQDATPLYYSPEDPDGDFDGAAADPVAVDLAWKTWRAEVAFAEEFVTQAPDLDITGHEKWRGEMSLRWVMAHMIEEYARHNGHADLLRERIDGRIGQ